MEEYICFYCEKEITDNNYIIISDRGSGVGGIKVKDIILDSATGEYDICFCGIECLHNYLKKG